MKRTLLACVITASGLFIVLVFHCIDHGLSTADLFAHTTCEGDEARIVKDHGMLKSDWDVIIVGAGLSGGILAERFANVMNKSVLIIEKRDHIGGNCYDYVDKETGVLANKYGAHLFHTDMEHVWRYVNGFADWWRYDHQVLAYVQGTYVPQPVNINTVNALLNLHLRNESEMDAWLAGVQIPPPGGGPPANSEDMSLSRVGRDLYTRMFLPYTAKQWGRHPRELDPEVTARIPVRNNFDNRYFSDRYQALPRGGYTRFFHRLLAHPNVTVLCDTDYFAARGRFRAAAGVYFTGRIDQYFSAAGLGTLEYRSLIFREQRVFAPAPAAGGGGDPPPPYGGYYQRTAVVNYPGPETDFTRIVEYKHMMEKSPGPHTLVVREYPAAVGEPYYPVPSGRNRALYAQFQELAAAETGVRFLGRLANYKYFNMDQAIDNALQRFEREYCPAEWPAERCRQFV